MYTPAYPSFTIRVGYKGYILHDVKAAMITDIHVPT